MLFHRFFVLVAIATILGGCAAKPQDISPARLQDVEAGASKEFAQDSADISPIRKKIVKQAVSALGSRFERGAMGSSTFDCSGLVKWAYGNAGIDLPRQTEDQAKAGTPVRDAGNLKPGDIVVLGDTPDHCTGIYAGGGKFIYSSVKYGKVKSDSIDLPYRKKTFIEGRNVIN